MNAVPPNQINLVSCGPLAPEGLAGTERRRDDGFSFIHISAFGAYELAIFTDLTNCLFYTTGIYLANKRVSTHTCVILNVTILLHPDLTYTSTSVFIQLNLIRTVLSDIRSFELRTIVWFIKQAY
jgi:hypothetical protein